MPEIYHPAAENPVSICRWLAYHAGQLLQRLGNKLEWWALYPDSQDEIPF